MARGKKTPGQQLNEWIRALVPKLKKGTDLKNACEASKIPYTTIVDYYKKNEKVRTRIDSARAEFTLALEQSAYKQAVEQGDGKLALAILTRVNSRYSIKKVISGVVGSFNVDMNQPADKKFADYVKQTILGTLEEEESENSDEQNI